MDKKNTVELLKYIMTSIELIQKRFSVISQSDDFKYVSLLSLALLSIVVGYVPKEVFRLLSEVGLVYRNSHNLLPLTLTKSCNPLPSETE